MTPSLPPFLSGSPLPDSPLRVGTEGLITALPVLIGFRPRDSLVVVSTGGPGGRRVGLTLRVDLPPADDPEVVEALCRTAAVAIAREAPSGAAVVVVGSGSDGAGSDGAGSDGAGSGGAVSGGAAPGGAGRSSIAARMAVWPCS
uniref:DUF4192 family protein n=1 Tax=Pseudonocardia pini TaxID=2758030 RepID=UPI0015F07945